MIEHHNLVQTKLERVPDHVVARDEAGCSKIHEEKFNIALPARCFDAALGGGLPRKIVFAFDWFKKTETKTKFRHLWIALKKQQLNFGTNMRMTTHRRPGDRSYPSVGILGDNFTKNSNIGSVRPQLSGIPNHMPQPKFPARACNSRFHMGELRARTGNLPRSEQFGIPSYPDSTEQIFDYP